MRQFAFVFALLLLAFVSFSFAETETPATPEPTASASEVAQTPTPKPELQPGVDVEGLNVMLEGPGQFRKDEIGVAPVSVGFRLTVDGDKKDLKLNTNPFKVLALELCHDDSRDKIQTPKDAPADGTEFGITLVDGSFFGGKLSDLEKRFDFEQGGRFWLRASFEFDGKKAISDWMAIDIYTRIVVRIVTREGEFAIWLRDDKAPKTAQNFLDLAKKGWFDHKIFHRVENQPSFKLIQGGCPHGDGSGGPGYSIPWEDNDLKHEAGAVAMGLSSGADRKPLKNSGGSQFYVCAEPIPSLDGNYCVFGKVIEGLETVRKIAAVQTDPKQPNRPRVPVEMEKVIIEYRK